MRALCGEKSFFSPLFTANLTLFFDKTSTRVGTSFWALSSPSSPTWPAPANIELQLTPKRWLKAPRSLNASLVPVSTKWTRPTRLKQSVTLAFKSLFTSKSFWNLLKMRRSSGSCKEKTQTHTIAAELNNSEIKLNSASRPFQDLKLE